jgi:hypothetical protein
MFTMDVPYVPTQQTPIVLVQADTSGAGATPQPDYILKYCSETESGGDSRSAMHAVDPASMLRNYLQNRDKHAIDLTNIKNITLLEGAVHGKITSVIDNTGRSWYRYDSEPEYVGNDRAVFMVEYQGVRFKVVVELHVFTTVMENLPSSCPPPQLIKVNGKPVSGSLGSDYSDSLTSTLNTSILSTLSVDPSSVTFNLADLPGGAVGQTVGTNITLDTHAAGYGWYIDPNPAANTDFLPTSNPDVWIAKAGSASGGKMHASAGSEILWLQVR